MIRQRFTAKNADLVALSKDGRELTEKGDDRIGVIEEFES